MDNEQPTPNLPVTVDVGASARIDAGASYRVVKKIVRLEADRFEVCQNYPISEPVPFFLRLFKTPKTRIVHNDGNHIWDIIDPFFDTPPVPPAQ